MISAEFFWAIGEPDGVRRIGEQAHLGDGVVLGDEPVGAGERVEVVDLDGVEAVGRALGDPLTDDRREPRAALGRGRGEHDLVPVAVDDDLAVLSRRIRSGWSAFHHFTSAGWIWKPLT